MITKKTLYLALPAAIVVSILACLPARADNGEQVTTPAVEAVRGALIRIHIVSADYRQGREVKAESSGSGVIISPDGYAVTNHHVTMDAERIACTLADRREVEAKLVGTDPLADIAVIKLVSPDGKPFPVAEFGDSSKLRVGQRIFALGCPLALSQSITSGIVSNTEMIMPAYFSNDEFRLEGEDVGSIVRWVGHDALIRPGNSGGPLVSDDGRIVGINEISVGLAGAIPSNLASEVVRQLIAYGKVTRSWLGIEVQPLLQSSGMDRGILVGGVLDGSPAKKAGFKSGDILTSLDGHEVTARFKEETPIFNQYVAAIPVGKTVEARLLRDGKEITINVTTEARQKAVEKESEIRSWGICGTNVTFILQKEMELASQDGVIVTGILPSGPAGAAKPSLVEGDVIVKVGDDQVKDITTLREATKKLTDGKTDPVAILVHFDRRQKHLATVIRVGKRDFSKPSIEIAKAWLGVDTQVLTGDLAEGLGVPGKTGVRVTQVYANGNALKAGVKVADLIVRLDGEDIPCNQIGDEEVFPSLIRQYEIGTEVKLGIIRLGKSMTISVKLEAAPKPARDYPKYSSEHFEFTARDIVFSDRANKDVAEGLTGAYVESVTEGGWAALGSMRSGDVIVEVGGSPVANLDALRAVMTDLTKKPKTVVFKVTRGVHTMFLEIQPSWTDSGV